MALVASLAPVYAVHGNHDYRANISLVDNIIRGSGASLLIDENITLERGNECLLLTGVDFPKKGGKKRMPLWLRSLNHSLHAAGLF